MEAIYLLFGPEFSALLLWFCLWEIVFTLLKKGRTNSLIWGLQVASSLVK